MVGLHFLSKIEKKKICKGSSFLVKLQLVKLQPVIKKSPSQAPFTEKLTQKIVSFYRISQRTKAFVVKVKHNFRLESR